METENKESAQISPEEIKAFLETATAAINEAQERIFILSEALQNLLDEQNGLPLIRREKYWQAAVYAAQKALNG